MLMLLFYGITQKMEIASNITTTPTTQRFATDHSVIDTPDRTVLIISMITPAR